MSLVLIQVLKVGIYLIYIKIAVMTVQDLSFTVIAYVPHQTILHLVNIDRTEGTLLSFDALRARVEVLFPFLVGECFSTVVRTRKFTHVEDVSNLAGNFHFLKTLLAKWADSVARQPLIKARTTDQSFAVIATCKFLKHVSTNRTNELLEYLFELRHCILYCQLLELVGTNYLTHPVLNICDKTHCPFVCQLLRLSLI